MFETRFISINNLIIVKQESLKLGFKIDMFDNNTMDSQSKLILTKPYKSFSKYKDILFTTMFSKTN